ncbi:MAG: hypothetical protein M3362_26425 [Acidobacteriota bacterium]|nr:hypothetical protein [Acidobacteriota bacterium]
MKEEIHTNIEQAEKKLATDEGYPFSPSAYVLLKSKIAEYISDLISESVKVSKRHRADTVSAAHIEQASAYLVSSTSKRIFKHIGTIGGIFLGASISNILAMTITGQYAAISTLVSATLGIIGAFMIALHIAKD